MADLAARLDAPGRWSTEAAEVFDELARASAGGRADYSGLSHALLDEGAAHHWPAPTGHPAGSPRVFTDRFGHPDGRARLVPVRPRPSSGRSAAPLVLTTGRALEHYQSGNQTRRVASLAAAVPEPRLEIHPDTAERWGIADGDLAEISSATGRAVARAVQTTAVRPDTVFVPFHFAGALAINRVVEARTAPISGMPDFKAIPVSVRVAGQDPPMTRKDDR